MNESTIEMAKEGFLSRYGNASTREAYELDIRLLYDWCIDNALDPLTDISRVHLEMFGRYLEAERGNCPVSVHRRLSTIRCFYRICAADGLVSHSPAELLRLPRLFKDETRTLGLDRIELGSVIACGRASSPSDAALVTLMGLLGLRVSEACNVRVEDTHGEQRGHRTLTLVGKGGKPATIPLPIPVARTIDLAAGGREEGPLLLRRDGTPMNRRSATRVVERLCKRAGVKKHVSPHSLRHSFVTACLDAGVPIRDVQVAARHSDPRMTMMYDRARGNLDRHAVYIVAGFIAGAA